MTDRQRGTSVIGLDLGTTSCKAVAVGADGRVLGAASGSYPLHADHVGQAEQQAEAIWQGAAAALHGLLLQVEPTALVGLCLSGAMHSLLPVTDSGEPLSAALTWADTRASAALPRLRARTDASALYRRTGCPLQAPYHPARLAWLLERDAARQAARFVALKDWLLFRLTGGWATDLTLASTTGLLDSERLLWDAAALALAGVGADRLPPLVPSKSVVGGVTEAAARATGLPVGLPVVAGGSDGAMAMLGAGLAGAGSVGLTVGTSGAIRRVVARPHLDPQERTWCYLMPQGWLAGGAINNGGLALQWVREQFYAELSAAAGIERLLADAATVAPGADGLLMLPYLTGERSPHWDDTLSATLHGLRLSHGRAQVARAALEGVAFCLADVWEVLREAGGGPPVEPLPVTGGITRAEGWMQIVADVLGVSLVPIEVADASALGAARLGHDALGNGLPAPIVAQPRRTIAPDPARHDLYRAQHRRFQALCRAVGQAAR